MADVFIPILLGRLKNITSQNPGPEYANLVTDIRTLTEGLEILANHFVPNAETSTLSWLWLAKLKDFAYEVDDALEEWQPQIAKTEEATDQKNPTKCWEKVSYLNPSRCYRKQCFEQDISSKIKELCKKFLEIALMALALDIVPTGMEHSNDPKFKRPRTTSSLEVSEVRGQKDHKKDLLKYLVPGAEGATNTSTKADLENGIQVISIVGTGGSGKTTLAQSLYNDDKVTKRFELRRWVHVGNGFDQIEIAKALLDPTESCTNVSELQPLKKKIRGMFSREKRFLIVFDDVWMADSSKWEPLLDSLEFDASGSKILVTTRMERAARAVHTNCKQYKLGRLSDSDCWSILQGITALKENPQLQKEVKKTGQKIARLCRGSPLVAKMVGDLLKSKNTKKQWEEALENEIWKTKKLDRELHHDLYSKYDDLTPEQKGCFSYCANFPKDAQIDVGRLIRLWMAEGYTSNQANINGEDKSMEEKGYRCFTDLVERSFFEDVKRSIHTNKITSCKVQKYHVVAEGARPDLAHINKKKFHLFLEEKVRTFIILSPFQVPARYLLEELKDVRALVLSCCQLGEVPSEVGNLTCLKYLDLSGNPFKELPATICDLNLLESLDVHCCYFLSSLPQEIGDLKKLRHLRINYTTDELHYSLPQGFWKLALMQTLDVIRVGGRYVNSAKLDKFADLEDIRIVIHGDVPFKAATLESKRKMKNLELYFARECRDLEKASLIEELLPPPELQMLKLEGYPGAKLPKWIVGDSIIIYLTRLSLKSALNISSLPALWKLSSLEFLWLYDLPKLKRLGLKFFGPLKTMRSEMESQKTQSREDEIVEEEEIGSSDLSEDDEETNVQEPGHPEEAERAVAFPKLETLRVEYLKNWETWEDLKENQISVMPKLKDLHIHGCPNLKALPPFILGKTSHGLIIITAEPKLKDAVAEHSRDQQSSKL